jgi:toxin ParE1/3/4
MAAAADADFSEIVRWTAERFGRKARHFVMFRIDREGDREVIEVLRILHDAMDMAEHVPPP